MPDPFKRSVKPRTPTEVASTGPGTGVALRSAIDTDITFILDRSGSMSVVRNAAIDGLNEFIAEQATMDGNCAMSLYQFDSSSYDLRLTTTFKNVPVKKVAPLTYADMEPQGGTPLLDAMGKVISDIQMRLGKDSVPKGTTPIVVIITDGQESDSRTWTREAVFGMIDELQTRGWEFIYIGAGRDTLSQARSFGIKPQAAVDWANNQRGTSSVFGATANMITNYRWSGKREALQYSAADREEQEKAKLFLNSGEAPKTKDGAIILGP